MRTLLDRHPATRVPISDPRRRRAGHRARRWIMRALDRLDDERRTPKHERQDPAR
jgi:hypothetical protein